MDAEDDVFIVIVDANPRYLDGRPEADSAMHLLCNRLWSLMYVAESLDVDYINVDLVNLDMINLKRWRGRRALVCGIYGDGCVEIAARQLENQGWNVSILKDATLWECYPAGVTFDKLERTTDIFPEILVDYADYWEDPAPPHMYYYNKEFDQHEQ